mgnify:CR=1 FL=1
MDTDDKSQLLYVNFFPSKERQRISIMEGRVSLLVMHQMAQERLANTELSYSVQVIDRYANERRGELEFNDKYVMPKISRLVVMVATVLSNFHHRQGMNSLLLLW